MQDTGAGAPGAGVASRRGLARGLESRPISPADLERAAGADHIHTNTIWMDIDSAGYLSCAAGAAAAAAAARLAPHVLAAGLVLSARGALRLRVERPAAPHDELRLWFDETALAALHMPFLTLHNIKGRREYECESCGARFEEPNPLKVHLFLRCADYSPQRFWRAAAARLASAAPPASAFRRVEKPASTVSPAPSASPVADAWAAQLEAAAAEWGRARGGHACLYCGKLYSRKYGLKIHLRTHTGYRPLRCRHCARAFGDPSNLNKHVRLHAAHTGAGASHSCSRCGKALARRRDLERHMRAHCALASPNAPAATAP